MSPNRAPSHSDSSRVSTRRVSSQEPPRSSQFSATPAFLRSVQLGCKRIPNNIEARRSIFSQFLDEIDDMLSARKDSLSFMNASISVKDVLSTADLFERVYQSLMPVCHRKPQGQFFTPLHVAKEMVDLFLDAIIDTQPLVLDPACGTGILLHTLATHTMKRGMKLASLQGLDKDPLMVRATRLSLKRLEYADTAYGTDATINEGDFFELRPDRLFDAIITNPPYVKNNQIENRESIREHVKRVSNVILPKTAPLSSYFMLAYKSLLRDEGLLVGIFPSEFLNSGYGVPIKAFLLKEMQLDVLWQPAPSDFAFDTGMSSALVIRARSKPDCISEKHDEAAAIEFRAGDLRHHPDTQSVFIKRSVLVDDLDPREKWLKFFLGTSSSLAGDIDGIPLIKLGDIASVTRGIATGHNDFFAMSQETREKYQLNADEVKHVVTKAAHCRYLEFNEHDLKLLGEQGRRMLLLSIDSNLEASEGANSYLRLGEEREVNTRYLARHRKNWYRLEKRKTPQLFVKVFSRRSPRFILCSAACTYLTAFHGIFLNEDVGGIRLAKSLILWLESSEASDLLDACFRVYGGGLNKLEPRDVEQIPIPPLHRVSEPLLDKGEQLFDDLDARMRNGTPFNLLQKEIQPFIESLRTEFGIRDFGNT